MIQMRHSTMIAPVFAVLALAACAVNTENDVVIPDVAIISTPGDECGASTYQQYVGQKSPGISMPPGTEFRHYRSGAPITMDYSATRVNFEYDRSGKLVKVSCG